MFVRSAMFVCAAAMLAAVAQPALADDAPAECAAMNLRVYFAPGSPHLDATATEMLNAAERQMASCDYAELHVRANGDALSRARAQAILAATRDGGFDLAQMDAAMLQRASMQGGPEFVALTMTPHRMNAPRARDAEAGV